MQIDTAPRTTFQSSPAANAVGSDLQTFLRMLTAQLQNQDPLNPLESTDFAVQLATFSGVEQQVQTNQLLQSLATSFGSSDLSQAANLIGGQVRSSAAPVFRGAPIELAFEVPRGAIGAEFVVRNSAGFEIARETIAPGTVDGVWSGLTTSGTPMPSGAYSFAIELPQQDGTVDTIPVESYSHVVEAEARGGQVMLVLESGASVNFSEISGVRGGA